MTGPKFLGNEPIEGSWKAHQVPLPTPATVPEQLEMLNSWLESYHPSGFFQDLELIDKYLIASDPAKRMGQRKETYNNFQQIKLPDWTQFAKEKRDEASETRLAGEFLRDVFLACVSLPLAFVSYHMCANKTLISRNPKTTRLFSPDELTSNKLDAVLQVTGRNFQWDPESRAQGGRVVEILSEHTCQGMLQGKAIFFAVLDFLTKSF